MNDDNLSINIQKDKTALYSIPEDKYDFDYLGYKFQNNGKKLKLSISDKKKEKYINKIKQIFDKYNKSCIRTPEKSRRELLLRLNFLTSNTRLSNNKGNAIVGIFNSNKWVTDTTFLKALDGELSKAISGINNKGLKTKLYNKYKFANGFEKRKFVNFSSKDFSIISKGWK